MVNSNFTLNSYISFLIINSNVVFAIVMPSHLMVCYHNGILLSFKKRALLLQALRSSENDAILKEKKKKLRRNTD